VLDPWSPAAESVRKGNPRTTAKGTRAANARDRLVSKGCTWWRAMAPMQRGQTESSPFSTGVRSTTRSHCLQRLISGSSTAFDRSFASIFPDRGENCGVCPTRPSPACRSRALISVAPETTSPSGFPIGEPWGPNHANRLQKAGVSRPKERLSREPSNGSDQYSSTVSSECRRGTATRNQMNGKMGLGSQYIQPRLRTRSPPSSFGSSQT
jgi:hypothetical protein